MIVAKYSAKDATAAWNSVLEAANQVRDASEEATVAMVRARSKRSVHKSSGSW
jgi:hypothetical protein